MTRDHEAAAGRPLADLAWPEVGDRPTVLVPVGSLEQHGPHLPLDTDTVIAARVAAAAAQRLQWDGDPVLVAPPLSYGASGEHQAFAGTVSLGHDALRLVLVELVRSLSTWAGRTVVVNGHGGNIPTVMWACERMRAEGHDVAWVPCLLGPDGDAHAGHDETSVLLHLDPGRVRVERAAAGNTRPLAELMPAMRAGGVAAVSPNGVLGDPTSATATHGAVLFRALVEYVASAVLDGESDEAGRLMVRERADA